MSCLLYAKDDDTQRQINLEELYAKEQKRNKKMLSTFQKILNRIHKRIQTTSRVKHSDKHVFFNVPEFILGEPNYEKAHCIAFLVTQLEENEFTVRYIHPNTLYISWGQYVPVFIRDQVKKKTGMTIDTKGKIVMTEEERQQEEQQQQQQQMERIETPVARKYKSTDIYKPTGQFVYGSELFDKIEKRFQN
jgi:hypothetical protein